MRSRRSKHTERGVGSASRHGVWRAVTHGVVSGSTPCRRRRIERPRDVVDLSLILAAADKTAPKKFWILDPLYTVLGHTFAWFYGIVGDYGLSIVLLTVAVRVLLIPLTMKQIRSMQAMQRLQPEIKRLQQKYKDDRQKLNEETMKFYKENKVNPLSGCLPLLLQLPLFIVLYRLIHDLTATLIAGAIVVAGVMVGTAGDTLPAKRTFQNVKVSDGTITRGHW